MIKTENFKEELLEGIRKLRDIVGVTYGPKGNNVLIKRSLHNPHATKDGVSVAEEVYLKGIEGIGADVVRQASLKTSQEVGDGTTGSCVLASYLIEELYSNYNDFVSLGDELRAIKEDIFKHIDNMSIDITDNENLLKSVATVSSNNDSEIGSLVAEAFTNSPSVSVEISRSNDTYIKTTKGISFDRGYLSPFFVTDGETEECVLNNPYILLYDGLITTAQQVGQLINESLEEGRPFVIIADDVKEEALNVLVQNKMKNNLPIVALKAPEFGDFRKEMMMDISVLIGGTYVSDTMGTDLDNLYIGELGTCEKIIVSRNTTTIVGGGGTNYEERMKGVKSGLRKSSLSPQREQFLLKRLAMFEGGVSTIYVGGNTEVEMRQRKDRVDDAVSSARSALKGGILPGSGWVLYKLSNLDSVLQSKYNISRCLKAPYYQIASNAGFSVPEADSLIEGSHDDLIAYPGYDFLKDKRCDLVLEGIVDPTLVVKSIVQNAFSVAEIILTTEGIIHTEEPETNEVNPFDPSQFI